MSKADLKLENLFDNVEEVDVVDLASGFSVLSPSSSTFASPSGISPSAPPRQSQARPTHIDITTPTQSALLPRNSVLNPLGSPSSPDLRVQSLPLHRPQLSRSQTLPKIQHFELKPKSSTRIEIEGLSVDGDTVTKIRRWILGIAIVDFDVDDGPVVNGVFPPLVLFPREVENIAFSAFPDSPQFDQGCQSHSFRIREDQVSVPSDRRPASKDGFMYGYSHFTQRKDSRSKRGYEQRSVVILTHHQFPALFTHICSIFGPLFQEHGIPMLEAACHNIATWLKRSDPVFGSFIELGFLGTVLPVELPQTNDSQQLTDTSSFREKYDPRLHILASAAPLMPPPLHLFEACLSNLWSIWECVVLCEPILVFGSSPAQTSQAIWFFRDLLRPIPLGGDIRPYFTIHDKDHSALVNKLPPKSGVLLGVTNPFFDRSCSHWPHILSLGRNTRPPITSSKPTPTPASPGPPPGWKTKLHKRYISKDRVLLKQLENACQGTEEQMLSASLMLRRHFCSRTNELLLPLARYLNTLIPTPSEVSKSGTKNGSLRLKPFNSTNFFASLKAHGTTLPFRSASKRTEFYERWLKTPAFGLWLGQQESIVQDVLRENAARAV
ncbi:hypothetical protein D9758_008558 [Tetrapyrgos nigripes]|uniref:UDENN domain-containing protein n=1 Tax=Tetrapyrgos nigripes TaxID=182062 RepID=A0A8H5LIW6_9AGAR|nr:hypothetical protein D9758_008558 [Tetrapyrgos nigripes]